MGEFLAEQLDEETPHKAIWNGFTNNPEAQAASISGALEALFEALPFV
jgi:hypothetical protein